MESYAVKENKLLDICLLSLGLGWVAYSFYSDLGCHSLDYFARSGSIMVLLAAIVEYRRIPLYQERLAKGEVLASGYVRRHEWSRLFKSVGLVAHVSVVLGTFIWGYGDVLLQYAGYGA